MTPEMRGQRVPKMPEQSENGGRGFTIGRGKGLPPPAASANGLAASNGGQRALGVLPPAAQATQDGAPPLEARLMHWQTAGTQLLQELQVPLLEACNSCHHPLAIELPVGREIRQCFV